MCQTSYHQLHQKNGLPGAGVLHKAQESNNVGMPQISQDFELLLKFSK